MRIHVLGGHGGLTKGFGTTSFLVDNKLLIDAGAAASTLTVPDQAKIEDILITHSHLDHIKDLAFLCDNCFGMKSEPFRVFTHGTVKKLIMEHLLNDLIWPDFTKLPSAEKPTMSIIGLRPLERVKIGDYEVTPVQVAHPNDAMGFIIEIGGRAVIFSGDTGPTDELWVLAKKVKNLKAIFTEVSFPNRLRKVAEASDHHTPESLGKEITKMPEGVPIILTHLKPHFREEILQEVQTLNEPRIQVLEKDGQFFDF